MHHRNKQDSFSFSLRVFSYQFTHFFLFLAPLFYLSQAVPSKSVIQSLKSSSFIPISGLFPLFNESVCGGGDEWEGYLAEMEPSLQIKMCAAMELALNGKKFKG